MHKPHPIALLITALFVIYFGASIANAKATFISKNISMGGRITATPETLSAGITCAAQYGPFTTIPNNIAVPGPYFIKSTTNRMPSMGKNILALYDAVPDTKTCFNPETGAAIPAFKIKIFGVSR